MKIDKWFHLYGRKDGIVLKEVPFEKLPSTQRKGKWIRKDDEQCYWYECSECGHLPPKDIYKQEWLSHFCPNCGTRMVRGEEE